MGETLRLSIVIAILDSHEIVRRQLLHFRNMPLPEGVEVVFVDDGSYPELSYYADFLTIHKHDADGEWTQPEARNYGVRQANGEFVLCTDIDHIIPKETIDFMLSDHGYDVVRFRRECGVLDEGANFTQDMDVMHGWGLLPERDLKLPPHGNSYCIRRGLFLGLGGSQQKTFYPNRDEVPLKRGLKQLEKEGKITILQDQTKPKLYMFPNGRFCGDKDYNPFNLFHKLSRK